MTFDLEKLRINGSVKTAPQPTHCRVIEVTMIRGRFLKGPIPLDWLGRAANLSGKALNVALAIRFLCDVKRAPQVKINLSRLSDWGSTRFAASRGLALLEKEKLVSVTRLPGQNPIVTLLPSPSESSGRSRVDRTRGGNP